MDNKIRLIIVVLFLPLLLKAQTVKPVTISANESFTDHLKLQDGSKDSDIMVKLEFDEANNVLLLSLNSIRNILVFQTDVRYAQVFRRKRFEPEKLPYGVSVQKKEQFRLNSSFKKCIKKPRKNNVFKRWLSQEGLIPRQMENKIAYDSIEQKFDIMNGRNKVSITLYDVILLGKEAKHNNKWWLTCAKDCDTRYEITIQRNPCFGLERDIKTAEKNLEDLQKGYNSIYSRFGNRKVASQEMLNLFQKLQTTLLQQFPRHSAVSVCPDLQSIWDNYNLLLDTISQMNCTVKQPEIAVPIELGDEVELGAVSLDAINLCTKARQIDEMVARWMITTDDTERRDLIRQCEQKIKETNILIRLRGVQTEEQRQAVKVFRAAERYYHTTTRD